MSPALLRRTAGALIALAVVVPAAAGAAGGAKANERMTLTSTTIDGVDHALRVVARGAVHGTGSFTGGGDPTSADDLITLRFAKGTITINGHEQSTKMTPNLRACTAKGVGRGTFTVTGGTGAYAGARGTIQSTYANGGAAYHYAVSYQT
jgi:hypothetical protein